MQIGQLHRLQSATSFRFCQSDVVQSRAMSVLAAHASRACARCTDCMHVPCHASAVSILRTGLLTFMGSVHKLNVPAQLERSALSLLVLLRQP